MDFEFELKSSQNLLDKLELEDAEERFCKLLSDLDHEKEGRNTLWLKNSMLQVDCLIGIAECRSKSFKMGRYLKDDFWFQCFILPLCLLNKSRQILRSILETNNVQNSNQADKLSGINNTNLENRLNRLNFNISSLEDNFVRGFLRKTFNGNNAGLQQPKLTGDSSVSVNKNWIFELMKVCNSADADGWSKKKKTEPKTSLIKVTDISKMSKEDNSSLAETSFSTDKKNDKYKTPTRLKTSQSFRLERPTFSTNKYCEDKSEKTPKSRDISPNPPINSNKTRTINFERFQDAIQNFVSDISGEIRTQYGHLSNVPESLIERRLASEIALRLSPGFIQAEDYINVLEGALVAGINEPAADDKLNDEDIREAEKLAEIQKLKELEREKERLLSLDDEAEEDADSYETLYFDIGSLLQNRIYESGKSEIHGANEISKSSSQQMALTWTDKPILNGVDKSLSLVTSKSKTLQALTTVNKLNIDDNVCQGLERLRRDILFTWKRLKTKHLDRETNQKIITKIQANTEDFSLTSEKHFEEMPDMNNDHNSDINETNIEVIIEDVSWLFHQLTKSNIISMFLELIVKASKYESKQNHHFESIELLQIADKILNEHWNMSNLDNDAKETVSTVWMTLGEELSKTGQVSKGSFYLEKQKSLTTCRSSEPSISRDKSQSIFEEVEGWCKLGDAYLGDDLRSESLLARLMQLTKQELMRRDEKSDDGNKRINQYLINLNKDQNKHGEIPYKNCDLDDDDEDELDVEQRDVYCTCLQEAVDCFSMAANVLRSNRHILGNSRPELWSETFTKMADCHLMSGNLDLAETAYDDALDHVSRAVGPELLQRNANAILSLATLCFLTGNDVRACTLLLTSLALRGKYCDKRSTNKAQSDYSNLVNDPYSILKVHNSLDLDEDDTDFGTVWTLMVLSLSHHSLRKSYQAISWASRAFAAHGKFFHGRLVAVDPLNRWFLVRILLSWATNHIVLSNPHESINRLFFAQKLLEFSGIVDRFQLCQIFKIFGDAYLLLSNGIGFNSDAEKNEKVMKTYFIKSEDFYSKALELLRRHETDKSHHDKLFEKISFFKTHKKYDLDNKLDKFESPQLQITWSENNKIEDSKPVTVKSKFDFILILLEMANDHVMNHNLDQSLACFVECSRELEKLWTTEENESEGFLLASVYFRLGRLLHVKYLMSCDQSDELQCYSDASIRTFNSAEDIARQLLSDESEALHLDILVAKSCLLYDLGKKYEAIQSCLPILFKKNDDEIIFSGQEIFALPKHLRSIFRVNYFDSNHIIKRRSLLGLLATTCFREIGLMDYATETICTMIANFNPSSESLLDHLALAFSFMNLKCYDEAYRVFKDLSMFSHEYTKSVKIYLSCCAYLCLLLHLRFVIWRTLWISLEKTFMDLKKTFRLLTFNEFLTRTINNSKLNFNFTHPKVARKIAVRSTAPNLVHVEWRSGSCSQQESSRKTSNPLSFKVETGISPRKMMEIPKNSETRNFISPPVNTSKMDLTTEHKKRSHPYTQIFKFI